MTKYQANFRALLSLISLLLLTGCASAPMTIDNVKLIGFDDKPTKGSPVGLIEGDDCSYYSSFIGYGVSTGSTQLRKALDSARRGATTTIAGTADKEFGRKRGPRKPQGESVVRYLNNVRVDTTFSNYVLFGKSCVVVQGKGFR